MLGPVNPCYIGLGLVIPDYAWLFQDRSGYISLVQVRSG
jgi:hypothetical protein